MAEHDCAACRFTLESDWYDWILVNSSAGKDSQAMLDLVVELARAAGVVDRVAGHRQGLGTRAAAHPAAVPCCLQERARARAHLRRRMTSALSIAGDLATITIEASHGYRSPTAVARFVDELCQRFPDVSVVVDRGQALAIVLQVSCPASKAYEVRAELDRIASGIL